MKNKKIADKEKNSNLPANQPIADVKITEDTVCIVTFNLPGAFLRRESNANSKDEIAKMKHSLWLDHNQKGRFICAYPGAAGRKLETNEKLPPRYYEGPKKYNPYKVHDCKMRRVYNNESIVLLSSIESRPRIYTKKTWEHMSIPQRLHAQFLIDAQELNAANPTFTFEFVNLYD